VTKYKVGVHIFGQGSPLAPSPDSAGLQEYATLRASDSALVPEGFTDDQVTTLPTNAVTAFTALFHTANFHLPFPPSKTFDYSSKTIVVIGAGSNVGKLTIQFAKMVRLGTVVAVASRSREKELKDLGATYVVDRHSDDVVRDVHAVVGGPDAVTYVIDCANWVYDLASELVSSTRPSIIVTLHRADSALKALDKLGKKEARAIAGKGLREHFTELAEIFWGNIGEWVAERKILTGKFRVIEGLDAEKVNEALDLYRDGRPVVQAIVHPHPNEKL
jgi:NADPH:quinone reductase